ncbi:MAG: F0F1 ATP synthase subunit A [Ruminococcus sp.]|nr:F0F1 ATP synthase subunit A [Ruminococcus sp.]
MLDRISEGLVEAMNNETAFTIHIFVDIPISVSCVVTWIIMAILVLVSIMFTRNLKLIPDRKQVIIETAVGFLRNFFKEQLGEKGMCYFPYLATVMIYIGFSNIIGIFGFTPPTKDLNVTVALSLMSIVLVEIAGIRAKSTKGWLKSFTQPIAIITPLNIMEVVIKPLSLCMRLFGNVLAAHIIMELVKIVCPVVIPLVFSAYFDIFDGFIQAYVFVFLTSLYIDEAMEEED